METLNSFYDTNPTKEDNEVYGKVITEWLELHPEKKFREPDMADIMEDIIECVQLKDDRWKSIKARHKKSTCKLYKSLYDMVDHRIDTFDKNLVKKRTPTKAK